MAAKVLGFPGEGLVMGALEGACGGCSMEDGGGGVLGEGLLLWTWYCWHRLKQGSLVGAVRHTGWV